MIFNEMELTSAEKDSFDEFCLKLLSESMETGAISDRPLPSSQDNKKPTKCNCLRSRCLKLYCECFANKNCCSPECRCKNCCNTDRNVFREATIVSTVTRNPLAFEHSRLTGTRGCRCKRSGCKKKYCECFLNGNICSALCQCEMCKNTDSLI